MRKILLTSIMPFFVSTSDAGSVFNLGENSVSTGKITVDGREVDSGGIEKGSGKIGTISRRVNEFKAINSQGNFDIVYRRGPYDLEIKGDDNLIPLLSTQVVGNELKLSMDKPYSTEHPLVVSISAPRIESFKIDGGSDVKIQGIKNERLTLELRGAVDVVAEGTVSRLRLRIQGTGDFTAKTLIADYVDVDMLGAGDAEITARKELSVKLVGMGDIIYYGRPAVVHKSVLGMGDLEAGD